MRAAVLFACCVLITGSAAAQPSPPHFQGPGQALPLAHTRMAALGGLEMGEANSRLARGQPIDLTLVVGDIDACNRISGHFGVVEPNDAGSIEKNSRRTKDRDQDQARSHLDLGRGW